MASLYETGWRQGSVVEADLPMDAVVLSEASHLPERRADRHGLWVVATQNCDLALTNSDDSEPSVELRPVFTDNPPTDWGIRSAQFRLTEVEHVRSASPRPLVSPAVLTTLMAGGAGRHDPDPTREISFTKWLGLR